MRSSRLTRRSTGILAIAALGMAWGLVAFRSGPPLSSHQQGPPYDISCTAFLKHGVDKSKSVNDAQGHSVRLYRTKGYYEHISKFPKWIGAVKTGNDPSAAFPNLPKNSKGCIYFQPYAVGQAVPYAQLWSEASTTPIRTYAGQLLCPVTEHDTDVTPEWKTTPDNCTTILLVMHTSKGEFSKEWVAAAGLRAATINFKDIEQGLDSLKVPADEKRSLIAAAAAPGPWYPCAETGCCRAFEM